MCRKVQGDGGVSQGCRINNAVFAEERSTEYLAWRREMLFLRLVLTAAGRQTAGTVATLRLHIHLEELLRWGLYVGETR